MNNVTTSVELSDGRTVIVTGYTWFGYEGEIEEQEAIFDVMDLSEDDKDICLDALADACYQQLSRTYGEESDFADPGGNSALRAATPSNPRNLPCPTCGTKNVLTPADRSRGYQCDPCADQAEKGY